MPTRIRIGVSACLLGQAVRYDGKDKRNDAILDRLGPRFELVPICPEVAIGLGIPRPPIRLAGPPADPRAVGVNAPGVDFTDRLAAYGAEAGRQWGGISGYVFKSGSPSCGLAVRVWGTAPEGRSRGIFARAFLDGLPLLPAVEEEEIADPKRRRHFLERLHAYRRWQELEAAGVTAARLARFHARHQPNLMRRDAGEGRLLASLLAGVEKGPVASVAKVYGAAFMELLAQPPLKSQRRERGSAACPDEVPGNEGEGHETGERPVGDRQR